MKEIPESFSIFRRLYVWYPDKLDVHKDYSYVKYISYNKFDNPEFEESKHKTLIVDLTKPEKEIFARFEKRCRNSITKAQKEKIIIDLSTSEKELEEFYEIYRDLCKQKRLFAHTFDFLKHGKLFLAWLGSELLSGALMVEDGVHSAYIIQASKRPIHGCNNFLLWEMMKHAKSKGVKTFDMGGVSGKEEGVDKFKLSFGGKETPVYHYERYNSKLLRTLKKLRR